MKRHTDKSGAYLYDSNGNTLAVSPDASKRARAWYPGKPVPKDAAAMVAAEDLAAACNRHGWRLWTAEDRRNAATV